MSWDPKRRGPGTGYFYESQRVAGKPHPVKLYRGRGAVGQLAAALVEGRKRGRQAARQVVRAEADAVAEADRLADELSDWASLLAEVWLVTTGHHRWRGTWRRRRGR